MKFLIIANKNNELEPDIFLCKKEEVRLIPAWACENRYDSITIKFKYEEEKENGENETNSSERPEDISKNSTDDTCY